MVNFIIEFLTAAPPLELFLIFISKIVEMTMSTLRIIMISKGYRKQGAILSFFEVLLWVFVASQVILGLAQAPIKGIVFSIGFAVGVYLGSRIENHIALGRVLIQAIVTKDNSKALVYGLRQQGYAITTLDAKGRDSDKQILMIYANRKGKEEITKDIHKLDNSAMIITNDVSTLQGGTIAAAKRTLS